MDFQTVGNKIIGNVVPVPGQFNKDLSVNLQGYRDHISFLLEHNMKVFYLAHSASEFGFMTLSERIEVTKTVSLAVGDNGIVLAQAVGGGWGEEQTTEAKMLYDAGATAIVVMPVPIKEGSTFFNCKYLRSGYSADRHDDYYVDYMEKFAVDTGAPLVFHDKLFGNGLGLSYDALERISQIENIVCLKIHMADPCARQAIYSTLGQKVASYDGLHKPLQLWSLIWGASARHTNYAWFDPDHEENFFNFVKEGSYEKAIDLVNKEWPLANVIRLTGYRGFKEVMRIVGLPSGPVRIPGEQLSDHHKKIILEAVTETGITTKI